jgi:hypothetical protein
MISPLFRAKPTLSPGLIDSHSLRERFSSIPARPQGNEREHENTFIHQQTSAGNGAANLFPERHLSNGLEFSTYGDTASNGNAIDLDDDAFAHLFSNATQRPRRDDIEDEIEEVNTDEFQRDSFRRDERSEMPLGFFLFPFITFF